MPQVVDRSPVAPFVSLALFRKSTSKLSSRIVNSSAGRGEWGYFRPLASTVTIIEAERIPCFVDVTDCTAVIQDADVEVPRQTINGNRRKGETDHCLQHNLVEYCLWQFA